MKKRFYLILVIFLGFASACQAGLPKASLANLINQGSDYYQQENYFLAIESYKKALGQDSSNPLIHLGLAASYLATHNYQLAVEHCLSANELNPALLESYFTLAIAYQGLNQPRQAIAAYRQALGLDLQNKHTFNQVSLDLSQEQQESSTVKAKPNPAELDFQMPQDKTNKSKNYQFTNLTIPKQETDQAEAKLRQRILANPTDDRAIYELGLLYIDKNQLDKAQTLQEKLMRHNYQFGSDLKQKIKEATENNSSLF
jgi:tetratricopeptide (TPR) repeat protein